MTEELKFYDEMPGENGKGRPQEITRRRAAELKAHPGKWTIWPAKGSTIQIQRQLDRCGEGFEVMPRRIDGAAGHLVRYVGPGGEALEEDDDADDEKVVCPVCELALMVPVGKSARGVLDSHYAANVRCRQSARGK